MPPHFFSPEQERALTSTARFLLVEGCAGSRKTDTLVRMAVDAAASGQAVLVLTMVGSVTAEITDRLGAFPGEPFLPRPRGTPPREPWRSSSCADGCVRVCTFDSMVHRELALLGDPILSRGAWGGDRHNEKARLLLLHVRAGRVRGLRAHGGYDDARAADLTLIDEGQDLPPGKVRAVAGALLAASGGCRGVMFGDPMQTVFQQALVEGEEHPLRLWRALTRPECVRMDLCWRCPPSHVRLANAVASVSFGADAVPMRPHLAEDGDAPQPLPLLFCYRPVRNQVSADLLAVQVCALLEARRECHPSEVAVLLPCINGPTGALVTRHLHRRLQAMFTERFPEVHDPLCLFDTRRASDGSKRPIDWSQAEGRCVMLSVHADKGRGHRVVVVLGLNEGDVPDRRRLFGRDEVVDASVLHVALTRSTGDLLLGFESGRPSRYVRRALLSLGPSAAAHGGLVTLGAGVLRGRGKDDLYLERPISRPHSFLADARDVARAFEHPRELLELPQRPLLEEEEDACPSSSPSSSSSSSSFASGSACSLPRTDDEEMVVRWRFGVPVEVQRGSADLLSAATSLFWESLVAGPRLKARLGFLTRPDSLFHTAMHELLAAADDCGFNCTTDGRTPAERFTALQLELRQGYPSPSRPDLTAELERLRARPEMPRFVLSSQVSVQPFVRDVAAMLAGSTDPAVFWNAAVAETMLVARPMRPAQARALPPPCLKGLMSNAAGLHAAMRLDGRRCRTDVTRQLTVREERPAKLQEMGVFERRGQTLGLRSRVSCELDGGRELLQLRFPCESPGAAAEARQHQGSVGSCGGGGGPPSASWLVHPLLHALAFPVVEDGEDQDRASRRVVIWVADLATGTGLKMRLPPLRRSSGAAASEEEEEVAVAEGVKDGEEAEAGAVALRRALELGAGFCGEHVDMLLREREA
jgi:hypothetical protein